MKSKRQRRREKKAKLLERQEGHATRFEGLEARVEAIDHEWHGVLISTITTKDECDFPSPVRGTSDLDMEVKGHCD